MSNRIVAIIKWKWIHWIFDFWNTKHNHLCYIIKRKFRIRMLHFLRRNFFCIIIQFCKTTESISNSQFAKKKLNQRILDDVSNKNIPFSCFEIIFIALSSYACDNTINVSQICAELKFKYMYCKYCADSGNFWKLPRT